MDLITAILVLAMVLGSRRGQVIRTVSLNNSTPDGADLTHLVVNGDRVYVAGRNTLHQLSADLKVERSVVTGPREDSVYCSARGSCQQQRGEKLPTDNYNKALLVDAVEQVVIACGSLFQGVCEKYSMDDISQKWPTIQVPLVANDVGSMSVAFIAPGLPDVRSHRVMYMASPHTQLGPYRSQEEIPAISSRSLKSHDIIRARRFVQARIKIASQSMETFHVNYVSGFYDEGYAYFLTIQPANADNADDGFVSKLVRVCANDPSYESYMEITLTCQSKGMKYNLVQSAQLLTASTHLIQQLKLTTSAKVLVAAFAASEGSGNEPKSSSSLCLFPMTDVNDIFERNAQLCFSGARYSRGLGFIAGANLPCPKDPRVVRDFCGEHLLIEGSVPLVAEALISYSDELITAVTGTLTPQHQVIFAGTSRGSIKKIFVKNRHLGQEYASVQITKDASPVRVLQLDLSQQFLYALSKVQISKVSVASCAIYSTCRDCLESQDPFCGWCSLEKRCSKESLCSQTYGTNGSLDPRSPPKWLPFNAHQCIDFSSLTPDHLPTGQQLTLIQLQIRELPLLLEGSYSCVFGTSSPVVVPAKLTSNGLSCLVPQTNLLPSIPANNDHVAVPVAVRSSETKKDFITRPLHLYDCSFHKSCQKCASSRWNCSWCLYDNKCSHDAAKCAVAPPQQRSAIIQREVAQCPTLSSTDQAPIAIPNMIPKTILLKLTNLPSLLNVVFECLMETEGRVTRTPATLLTPHSILCQEAVYYYDAEVAEHTSSLSVVWNWNQLVDSINITLYKCRIKGPDCSMCLTRHLKYHCTWKNEECQFSNQLIHVGNQTCPAPSIDSIFPVSGPVDGGTQLTIVGRELGMRIQDLTDAIKVAGVPCIPIEYDVSRRVVCKTSAATHTRSGPVVIQLPARSSQASYQKFYFLNASITHMSPSIGPRSGGTKVTLTGNHLDIGSEVSVTVGNVACNVERESVTATRMSCYTTTAPADGYLARGATLQIDGANRTLDATFLFVADPIVSDIEPLTVFSSGGIFIRVYGDNFESVQLAQLFLRSRTSGELVNSSRCQLQTSRLFLCPSPSVLLSELNTTEGDGSLELDLSLGMDGWTSDLSPPYQTIKYLADPMVLPFRDAQRTKLFQGEALVIQGERLNLATKELDYRVMVGEQVCNITSVSEGELICLPPPSGTVVFSAGSDPLKALAVVVHIGNLAMNAGFLQYVPVASEDTVATPDAVAGTAIGTGLLLLISVVALLLYRRRSSRAEREYKRIRLQMDTLESHVRMECKQAFAELQTDISDLTSDLQISGIPYLDHRMYIMKIFFPLSNSHPVLHDLRPCRNNRCTGFETTMLQFEELLCNQTFLLTFVSALEAQRTFGIRDRANVASLLMVVLLDKLDYVTEIFRHLLLDLMERSILSKHPQLMLRRAESVVEKMMSNWIALCMFDYLHDGIGSSLFLLFQAVKCQVEKGPVDCLTHDARYSLSEERLLREQLDYHTIAIDLHQDDLDEKVQCRVLDCDCISQVKAKLLDSLYKTTPSSTRPSVYEIDLEWHNSQHGRVILQDEDATSQCRDGWRRLNTLQHYGIRESAVMTLVLKSQDGYHPESYEISPYSISALPCLSRDYSGKIWHLTKPLHDDLRSSGHVDREQRTHSAIPEIFLTRLLSTKGTVQKFVDDLFHSILTVTDDLPPPIKWLFDLYDDYALQMGISDPQVIHAWKSNSLPLRFWVNLIKNPEFLFDIHKTPTLDACMSVIAQTFMDSCSLAENARLGKDSPSNKLLFAKDIPQFRGMVRKYYTAIQDIPPVQHDQVTNWMSTLSKKYAFQLNVMNGLKELFSYAIKYHVEISEKLEENPTSRQMQLSQQFDRLCASGGYLTLPVNCLPNA